MNDFLSFLLNKTLSAGLLIGIGILILALLKKAFHQNLVTFDGLLLQLLS